MTTKKKKKPKSKTLKKKPALKAVKKPKVWTKKPVWQYDFNTKKYEMTEVVQGVTYKAILDQLQFHRMMDKCINTVERKEWLATNKLQPTKQTTK
jgi:hypothetical protein